MFDSEEFLMRVATIRLICFFSVGILVFSCSALAQKTGVAATPPMGWNSWNHFAGKVDDAAVRAAAEAMVSSGMRDAGYVYVNIDDTLEGTGCAGSDSDEQQVSGYEGSGGFCA
jgi:alpha-galactosidase